MHSMNALAKSSSAFDAAREDIFRSACQCEVLLDEIAPEKIRAEREALNKVFDLLSRDEALDEARALLFETLESSAEKCPMPQPDGPLGERSVNGQAHEVRMGRALRRLREVRKVTPDALSRKLGVPITILARIEQGEPVLNGVRAEMSNELGCAWNELERIVKLHDLEERLLIRKSEEVFEQAEREGWIDAGELEIEL